MTFDRIFVEAILSSSSKNSLSHLGHLASLHPKTASRQPMHAIALEYIRLNSKLHFGQRTLLVLLKKFGPALLWWLWEIWYRCILVDILSHNHILLMLPLNFSHFTVTQKVKGSVWRISIRFHACKAFHREGLINWISRRVLVSYLESPHKCNNPIPFLTLLSTRLGRP